MRLVATKYLLPNQDNPDTDAEIKRIMAALDAEWIGQGTHFVCWTREWEYEVAPNKVDDAWTQLDRAGFEVEIVGGAH